MSYFQDPIGSIRYLRGTDCLPTTVVVTMDWANVSTEHTTNVLCTKEEKNTTFDFSKPEWDLVTQVEGSVNHRYDVKPRMYIKETQKNFFLIQ